MSFTRALGAKAWLGVAAYLVWAILAAPSVATAAVGPAITDPVPAPGLTITTSNSMLSASVADDVALSSLASLTLDRVAYPMVIAYVPRGGHWVGSGCDTYWVVDYDLTHGSLARQLTGLADGSHAATLTVTDVLGRSTSRPWTFTVATPPVFSAFTPLAGGSATVAQPVISAHFDGASQASFQVNIDGRGVVYAYSATTRMITCTPPAPLANGAAHTVAITCLSTSPRKTSTWTFTALYPTTTVVGNMRPAGTVSMWSPTLSADATSGLDILTAALSVDGAPLTATIGYQSASDHKHATVTATPPMLADGSHTVSLTLATAAGSATPTVWSFSVAAPPAIGSLSPADASTSATTAPAIFAVVADNGAVVAGTFTLDGVSTPAVWDPVGKTLTCPLAAPLSNDDTHTVTLSTVDGSGLTASKTWSFGTQIYSDGYATSACTSAGCHVTFPSAHPVPADCHLCHHPEDPTMTQCAVCHTSPQPHGTSVFSTSRCASCHDPAVPSVPQHPTVSNEALHLTSADLSTCRPCHVRSISIEHARHLDTKGAQITCRTCHDSTDVLVAAAIAAKDTTCLACHVSANHEALHATTISLSCQECHSSSLSTEHITKRGFTCDTCHKSTDAQVSTAIATHQIQCSACHGADHTLAATFCYGCHTGTSATYPGKATADLTPHLSTASSTKALVAYPSTSSPYPASSCVNCHTNHGTLRAEGNALCHTCHDAVGTIKPVTYSYQGTSAYAASAHGGIAGSSIVSAVLGAGSTGFEAWESSVQPTPANPGQVMTAAAKSALQAVDASRAVTNLAKTDNATDYQMYRFKMPAGQISKLSANWAGFGEMVAGYPVGVSIWNTSLNSGVGGWELVRSQQMSNETALAATESSSTHVTSDGYVYLMAQALNLVDTKIVSTPVVSSATSRTATVTWATQGYADSWVDFGRAASYGSLAGTGTLTQVHTVTLPLTGAGSYHIRARSTSRDGDAYTSGDISFGVPSPVATHIPDSTVTGSGPVTFSWSAPAGATGPFTYQVHLWDGAGIDLRYAWQSATTLGATLTSGSYYHWQVEARDSGGLSYGNSAIDSFYVYEYAPPGTCPYLFTWDGTKMVFESDLNGASKLAVKQGATHLTPNPNDYYILKTAPAIEGGTLDLRMVEERNEVNYLDQLKLYALDVPAGLVPVAEIPRYGTSALPSLSGTVHTVSKDMQSPARVTWVQSGQDVTSKVASSDSDMIVLNTDRNDGFDYQTLEADLGAVQNAPQVKLVIDGRTAFPDSPAGLARAATFPMKTELEVQDASGNWVTPLASVATLPRPNEFYRPYVIDLTHVWQSDSRKVRLTFLFKTYIDSLKVDTTLDAPVVLTAAPLASATLRPRGFDPKSTTGELYEYTYGTPTGLSQFFPGAYTRYGDVSTLLSSTDDMFAVYGGGDEVAMRFRPPAEPGAGLERHWLVSTDAYYKDMKSDTTKTVDPLPFAAMSAYPYPSTEAYPTDADHQSYLAKWNTRVIASPSDAPASDPLSMFWSGQLAAAVPPSGQPGVTVTEFTPSDGAAAHRSLNTDFVSLTVAIPSSSGRPAGDCETCHAVHGKTDPATGRLISASLNDTETSLCTSGGNGACHSLAGSSVSGVDINARLTASADPSSHHDLGAGSTSGLTCSSCHDPHANSATSKYSDPAAIGTPMASGLDKYLDPSGQLFVAVGAQHDGAAPVISGVSRSYQWGRPMPILTWTTNENATTRVDLGTTPSFEMGAFGTDALSTAHTSTLPTLTVGTMYYYRLRSTDAVGNTGTSVVTTYSPTAPVISAVVVDKMTVGTTLPIIRWNTDEIATTWVDWGTITYAGHVGSDTPLTMTHAVNMPRLAVGWTYIYRIRSADAFGNSVTTTGTYTPTTALLAPAAPTITTPVPTGYVDGTNGPTSTTVTLAWNPSSNPNGHANQYQAYVGGVPQGWRSSTTQTMSVGAGAYPWYVVARDAVNTDYVSPASNTSTFSIIDNNPPPSGSCPFLFVWDGTQYVFEGDLYAAGKLATKTKAGYLKPNPYDAWVLRSAPVSKDGSLEMKIVEERYEADYLDQLKLYTADVPSDRQVVAETPVQATVFNGVPSVLHTAAKNLTPVTSAVRLDTGEDVTAQLSSTDSNYVVLSTDRNLDFTYRTLELDLGAIQSASTVKIVMNAVSAFPKSAAGTARSATFGARTKLEVQDAAGAWVAVPTTTLTLPKPPEFDRTFAFDISKIWISDSRKVRFTYLFKTYIDSIFVDTTPDLPVTLTEVPLQTATLAVHGIDATTTPAEVYQYSYGVPITGAKYFPGAYTKLGDVTPLLSSADDKFVVYGGGDELTLKFSQPAAASTDVDRQYVMYTDGFYKDNLVDVAHTVDPLPFHAMSNFPYSAPETYPTDADHTDYLNTWNTRVEAAWFSAVPSSAGTVLPTLSGAALASRFSTILGTDQGDTRLASAGSSAPLAYSVDTDLLSLMLTSNADAVTTVAPTAGWETSGTQAPAPSAPGVPVAASQLAKTASADGTYWRTDMAQADRSWNWQVAKYKIDASARNATKNLKLTWRGHGEPTPGYPVALYLWNFQSGTWDQIATAATPTDTLYGAVQEDVGSAFCLRCHKTPTPAGITMPLTVKNVGAFWGTDSASDIHGDRAGGPAWYFGGGGDLAPGYSRGSAGIPCATCHDPHGNSNLDHIAAVINGQPVAVRTRTEFRNACAACHTGGTYAFHQGCNDCHTSSDSHVWAPTIDDTADCLACHGHGSTYTHPASCHCGPTGYKWKTF